MTSAISFIVVMLAVFAVITSLAGRIPKTGRCSDASGEVMEATIVNKNKMAEKAVTMKLKGENGKKYKVKLKPDEAKLWIKGDKVKIVFSENKKDYRVLFHDYFKENDERIRQHALKLLEKGVSTHFVAARMVGYTKESPEAFRKSGADAHTVFSFLTYMKLIDLYSVVGAFFALLFVVWFIVTKPELINALIPLLLVGMVFYVLSGAAKSCKAVLKKVSE